MNNDELDKIKKLCVCYHKGNCLWISGPWGFCECDGKCDWVKEHTKKKKK